jgi:hypothetical protein
LLELYKLSFPNKSGSHDIAEKLLLKVTMKTLGFWLGSLSGDGNMAVVLGG